MQPIGPALTELLERYISGLNSQVVVPVLRELDQVESDQIAQFRSELTSGGALSSVDQFATNIRLITTLRSRIKQHYKVIEQAVFNGL
jgi:hypothetical protein